MASTAHTSEKQIREKEEPLVEVERKAELFAEWLRDARHAIAFTGAGISTSCGIPDFRGPDGVWTLRAQGRTQTKPTTQSVAAIPSRTHMALKDLLDGGVLAGLVSQNTDGLHRKSGVDVGKFAELHGNTNRESCAVCGQEYLRDFRCRSAKGVKKHETGRTCSVPKCGGALRDTIINFGENLDEHQLDRGFELGRKSDLCLAMGSSLTVSPANSMAKACTKQKGGRLVIVNLQDTPYDDLAALRVYAKTDQFMELVMKHLDRPIPEWRLRRWVSVRVTPRGRMVIQGVDADGTPYEFIRAATCKANKRRPLVSVANTAARGREPFTFKHDAARAEALSLQLAFFGHYKEPVLDLELESDPSVPGRRYFALEYNPFLREWRSSEVMRPGELLGEQTRSAAAVEGAARVSDEGDANEE